MSIDYKAYLQSTAWAKKRRRLITNNADADCYCCHTSHSYETPLDLHHLTYERLGNELDTDLVPVCRKCHDLIHSIAKSQKLKITEATDKAREIVRDRIRRDRPTTSTVPVPPPFQRPPVSLVRPPKRVHPGSRKFKVKRYGTSPPVS
jgi:hypothetical protein